jgi:hypothetical protein
LRRGFSSFDGFDFGARKRGYGWRPRTYKDLPDWYNPFIEIALEEGKHNTARGKKARRVLGDAVRGLCTKAGLHKEISSVGKEFMKIDGWPEGWLGTRRIMQWDKDEISGDSLQEVRDLEKLLAPRDLKTKIEAKVLANGAYEEDDCADDGDADTSLSRHERVEREAEHLGKMAATERDIISDLLPDLLCKASNSKVWIFGFGVGQESVDPVGLIGQARQILKANQLIPASLMFLRGFIFGWHKEKPEEVGTFLDEALRDDVWSKCFPELQLQIPLDDIGYNRLLTSLELGNTPARQYYMLAGGRVTDPLSVEQLSTLVKKISSKGDGGLSAAIDILAMVIHCAEEKSIEYRRDLAGCCALFLQQLDWSQLNDIHDHIDYDVEVIFKFTFAFPWPKETISAILQNLLTYERSEYRYLSGRRGKILAPLFKYYPFLTLDAIYIPDEDGAYFTALRIVSSLDGDWRETAIHEISLDSLLTWCEISPTDRYVFAAQTCRLFIKKSEADSNPDLSDIAINVLAKAPDKKTIIEIMADRFQPSSWGGSRAAILRSRLPLFSFLNPTNDEELGGVIKQVEESFRKIIGAIEKEEDERERHRSNSFE